MEFFESLLYTYIILPVLIFTARLFDVSMGTMRIILLSKGFKKAVPVIAFFEMLIWILAITRIMQNLDNWICYIAYAGGFATGNYMGMRIEEKIALGYEIVRIITKKEANELVDVLREKGFGLTSIKAEGSEGEVAVLYLIINRKKLPEVVEYINQFNPNALYTIEDIRYVNKSIYFSKKGV
ncbi:DUF2179 domain-containing protein [Bacteroidota bacterium]